MPPPYKRRTLVCHKSNGSGTNCRATMARDLSCSRNTVPTHGSRYFVAQSIEKGQSVLLFSAKKMNRRWVCNDVLMDIFPFFYRPELGLQLALLSCRFDALVDKHFDAKKELTLWNDIRICKGIGPKAQLLVDWKLMEFQSPDHPLPNKIRFEELHIKYIDHSVIAFLRSNKHIWDRNGTQLDLFIKNDQEPIWGVFVREIWPIFAPGIRHFISKDIDHLADLRRLISPTILFDLKQLNCVDSDLVIPDGIADDGPNATSGQALSKWLNTPREDGLPPKTLFCRFDGSGASKVKEWLHNFKEAFLRATTSVSYNIGLTISLAAQAQIVQPFEAINEMTQEKLTLQKEAVFGKTFWWKMNRYPIGETETAVQQQKKASLDKLNKVHFTLYENLHWAAVSASSRSK